MNWLSEYVKAWARHNIHFGLSGISHLNVLTPPQGQSSLIVDDECLTYRFRHSHAIRAKKGQPNDRFLNPTSLLRVLDGLPEGLIVILPVPQIYKTEELSFHMLLERFDRFLLALPCTWRYAIELHNNNYLLPEYFECLRRHNVAHVIGESPIFTSDFGLIRDRELPDVLYAVRQAIEERKKLYVYLDDQAAVVHLMKLLNHDLKKLSPIKSGIAA